MVRVVSVLIQRPAIIEFHEQTGVERAVKMKQIGAHFESADALDRPGKIAQAFAMFLALHFSDLRFIFPTNDVYQHSFATTLPDHYS